MKFITLILLTFSCWVYSCEDLLQRKSLNQISETSRLLGFDLFSFDKEKKDKALKILKSYQIGKKTLSYYQGYKVLRELSSLNKSSNGFIVSFTSYNPVNLIKNQYQIEKDDTFHDRLFYELSKPENLTKLFSELSFVSEGTSFAKSKVWQNQNLKLRNAFNLLVSNFIAIHLYSMPIYLPELKITRLKKISELKRLSSEELTEYLGYYLKAEAGIQTFRKTFNTIILGVIGVLFSKALYLYLAPEGDEVFVEDCDETKIRHMQEDIDAMEMSLGRSLDINNKADALWLEETKDYYQNAPCP